MINAVEDLEKRLSRHLNLKLELVINENHSTMLSLLEKKRDSARLSLHRMFLQAPEDVISAIAHYVKGTRKGKAQQNLILRDYIQNHLSKYDYSHLVNPQKLVHEGNNYHLKEIYNQLNKKYFNNALHLFITWYGSVRRKSRSRITYGQYLDGLRLIKIHRMLDDPFFPEYFVSFVVYHEMLHSLVPGFLDHRGFYRFHSQEFKKREREFEHYQKALEWEKKNKIKLFSYGRT